MTLTDFLQPLDLDTHIRMAEADTDIIYFGRRAIYPCPSCSSTRSRSAGRKLIAP